MSFKRANPTGNMLVGFVVLSVITKYVNENIKIKGTLTTKLIYINRRTYVNDIKVEKNYGMC